MDSDKHDINVRALPRTVAAAYYPKHYIMTNQYDKAEEMINRLEILNPKLPSIRVNKAWLFAARGQKEEALALHANAAIYSLLGMKDEAIALLEKGLNNPTARPYLSLVNLPIFDILRDDPRFQEILEKKKQMYERFLEMAEGL